MKSRDDGVIDLSKEAVAEREKDAKLRRAAGKAKAMNRAFKGIARGGRRYHAMNALRHEGLID